MLKVLAGRLPHGRRGLKHIHIFGSLRLNRSPPSREAWIETYGRVIQIHRYKGRLPHGRRGLKPDGAADPAFCGSSPPSREAWIETCIVRMVGMFGSRRLPHGRRGLKLQSSRQFPVSVSGRLPHGRRGLKYITAHLQSCASAVASLTGGVD